MELSVIIRRQNCYYKRTEGNSGETSINISNEIYEFIRPSFMNIGEQATVIFSLYKDDFVRALCYIVTKMPLYKSSSTSYEKVDYNYTFFLKKFGEITNFFGARDKVSYAVNLLYRKDGRKYLNNLSVEGFNLRNFLIEDSSKLVFIKESGAIRLRLVCGDDILEEAISETKNPSTEDTIQIAINGYQKFEIFLRKALSRKGQPFSDVTISNYLVASTDPFVLNNLNKIAKVNSLFEVRDVYMVDKLYDKILPLKENKNWNYTYSAMLSMYREYISQDCDK